MLMFPALRRNVYNYLRVSSWIITGSTCPSITYQTYNEYIKQSLQIFFHNSWQDTLISTYKQVFQPVSHKFENTKYLSSFDIRCNCMSRNTGYNRIPYHKLSVLKVQQSLYSYVSSVSGCVVFWGQPLRGKNKPCFLEWSNIKTIRSVFEEHGLQRSWKLFWFIQMWTGYTFCQFSLMRWIEHWSFLLKAESTFSVSTRWSSTVHNNVPTSGSETAFIK